MASVLAEKLRRYWTALIAWTAVPRLPLFGVAVAAAIMCCQGAFAQGDRWPEAIDDWADDWDRFTVLAACMSRLGPNPSIALIGVPDSNGQINIELKRLLFNKVRDEIQRKFILRSPDSIPKNIQIIQRRERSEKPSAAAMEELQGFYRSDMFLFLNVNRWSPSVMELEVLLLVKPSDGKDPSVCESTKSIDIDLATMEQATASGRLHSGIQFYDLRGALRAGIEELVPRYRELADQALPYVVKSGLQGRECEITGEVERAFEGAYSDAMRSDALNTEMGAPAWPLFRNIESLHDPGEQSNEPVLTLNVTRPSRASDENPDAGTFIGLRLALIPDKGVSVTYDVAVESSLLRGCSGAVETLEDVVATVKADPRHNLSISPLKNSFVPDHDSIEIDIALREPLYLYCWLLADDGTAVVVFPNEMDQLRGPFEAGRTYRFPDDFFKERKRMPVRASGRSLFECFSSGSPVSNELKSAWIGGFTEKTIGKSKVKDFLERFRDLKTVGEATAWINHTGE